MAAARLTGFASVSKKETILKNITLYFSNKMPRITFSKVILKEAGLLEACRIDVLRNKNRLAITAGDTYSVDHSYSSGKSMTSISGGFLKADQPFKCLEFKIKKGVVILTLPPELFVNQE